MRAQSLFTAPKVQSVPLRKQRDRCDERRFIHEERREGKRRTFRDIEELEEKSVLTRVAGKLVGFAATKWVATDDV